MLRYNYLNYFNNNPPHLPPRKIFPQLAAVLKRKRKHWKSTSESGEFQISQEQEKYTYQGELPDLSNTDREDTPGQSGGIGHINKTPPQLQNSWKQKKKGRN